MIVVIGSINMDLVLHAPRMPLPGETLQGGPFRLIPGGKGANQAVACARLDHGAGRNKGGGAPRVAMIGCLGDDAFGTTLRNALRNEGIDDSYVSVVPGTASGVASILVDAGGQNCIVLAGGANDNLSPAHIDAARSRIEQASIVVLQLEIPLETVRHAVGMARALGKTVVLNPAPAQDLPADLLAQVDYLIPNEVEVAALCDAGKDLTFSERAARLRATGCRNVLTTLGSKGIHAALEKGEHVFPAQRVKAVDTTAAGDTFIGGFVAALAGGLDELDAIAFGQRAAAWSVMRVGAQSSIPRYSDLKSF